MLEWFSTKCSKTQTKVITLANHNKRKQNKDQTEREANTCYRRQARENANDQVTISFSLVRWLVKKVAHVFRTNHRAQ